MCGTCVDVCPQGAVFEDDAYRIDPELCEGCGICADACLSEAISRV
jgi:MinD superfamily P-loop ATPase